MRKSLEKAFQYGDVLEVMYLAKDGSISKRKIRVLSVHHKTFSAYCFLRHSKRTFLIDNVLAVVPVKARETVTG
ncbi:transcriptional regulator [Sporosarcina sp. P37]|uniref:transcriptional regulator n=1 Tax=unclassified Sporosarcina TaxID=2647733 RepID=UPI0009BD3062|nr:MULTISPECIES: transcriptional regulator [unclassified Sporosarcina]ARD49489.1 transcriptional regulator [Sporosarcina sp. P33]ARK26031.1 transcriptional regulator [Sporosarcina sp. P37]PID19399.1 transcriptional regulator [Sporosarcina sp. P35]